MTIHSEDLELLEEEVNPIKVGEIVVDALLPITAKKAACCCSKRPCIAGRVNGPYSAKAATQVKLPTEYFRPKAEVVS